MRSSKCRPSTLSRANAWSGFEIETKRKDTRFSGMTTSPFSFHLFGDAATVDLTVVLLMLVFGIAIGSAGVPVYRAAHGSRRRRGTGCSFGAGAVGALDARSITAGPIRLTVGWRSRWRSGAGAARPGHSPSVALLMEEGISAANHQRLFLTPPFTDGFWFLARPCLTPWPMWMPVICRLPVEPPTRPHPVLQRQLCRRSPCLGNAGSGGSCAPMLGPQDPLEPGTPHDRRTGNRLDLS